mmetsp:Transcript_69256/g.166074  ORF Transcript_69256/g.166074 Transcript_69256/m.166074 type:complete len:291 (-) Transcript_69256:143-1015(-)
MGEPAAIQRDDRELQALGTAVERLEDAINSLQELSKAPGSRLLQSELTRMQDKLEQMQFVLDMALERMTRVAVPRGREPEALPADIADLGPYAAEALSLAPSSAELQRLYESLPATGRPAPVLQLPVALLRFSQKSVNAAFAFSNGRSIFETVHRLNTGRVRPRDLGPLEVFMSKGPDGNLAFWSRCNRRLAALLMHQSLVRDRAVVVPCKIFSDEATGQSPEGDLDLSEWFHASYCTQGTACGGHCSFGRSCRVNGMGFSLHQPRGGGAKHNGKVIFMKVEEELSMPSQ